MQLSGTKLIALTSFTACDPMESFTASRCMAQRRLWGCHTLRLPKQAAPRPQAATRVVYAVAEQPSNLIGVHSGVFVGDWRPEDADRAVKAASDAGYDLIERAHAAHLLQDSAGRYARSSC